MNRRLILGVCCLLGMCVCLDSRGETSDDGDSPFLIGGAGGAYFLAEPGELVIELEKRDRNRRNSKTELRAILVGPDRQVLQEAVIPDDGKPRGSGMGPAGRVRLSTQVKRKGVFGLNITVSQDRYGDDMVWGFRTNCPRYLIETARGHRDERRQEPIVAAMPDRPGNVCFVPRKGAFGIEISGLPKGSGELTLYDAKDSPVATLTVDAKGQAVQTIPADVHRDAVPWRLHLPTAQATIQIDGVTRWEARDSYPNLPYWTPDPASYFPFQDYRWLLTPYNRIVPGEAGQEGQTDFEVHNNSDATKTVKLAIEFPGDKWPFTLSENSVTLGRKKSAKVSIKYTVGAKGQARVCQLRATSAEDPGFSTYSTLTVKAATRPMAPVIDVPLLLKPYRHENRQFDYLPDYPVDNQVYFDLTNRPFVRSASGVKTLTDGQWTTSVLRDAVRTRVPAFEGDSFGVKSSKVAFDRDNDLYLLATAGSTTAVLHSSDGGKTFSAHQIPRNKGRSGSFDIEQFTGHNVPDGPPPIVRYTRTATDSKLKWRRVNDLELILPKKIDGRLSIGEPIMISRLGIGLSTHSGIPATVVSRGDKVHVAWGEATEPDADVPGVPAFVVTYDRATEELGKPVLIGYGAPPNDVHNSPSITIDSQGYLHALAGTHGTPFQYARSLKPNDAGGGWTKAVPLGDTVRQTYIGFVCGADDTLYVAFRMWRSNTDPFPLSHHATLAYQRKPPGKPWEEPQVLVVAPFSEYSIFYHRLTIDRTGRLFLSYDYWSTHWFYRTDHRGDRRTLMMSPDGGQTWKLPQTVDFQ